MRAARGRISQSEIATAAGVSVSTVSRVLAGVPGISEEVRRSVRQVAQRLGHELRDEPGPRRLRAAVAYLAASDDLGTGTVYHYVLEGIRAAADAAGLPVSVVLRQHLDGLPARVLEEPDVGAFFMGVDPSDAALDQLALSGVPTVLVNGLDPELRVDAVAPANFFGGRLAARHLAGQGHRRLLHVTTRQRWTLMRRAEGFLAGVRELGNAFSAEVLDLQTLQEPEISAAIGRRLERNDFPYTAILCGHDLGAIGLVQALRAAGLRVPEDISVMGFDDVPLAALGSPPLTTVRVDWRLIGREAVRLMMLRQHQRDESAVQVQVGARIVARASVAPRG